jgi:hypothetical protein
MVVNCTGFEDLPHSSSTLIRNLVEKKLCTINSTLRGFEVNEEFEAQQAPILARGKRKENIHSRLHGGRNSGEPDSYPSLEGIMNSPGLHTQESAFPRKLNRYACTGQTIIAKKGN